MDNRIDKKLISDFFDSLTDERKTLTLPKEALLEKLEYVVYEYDKDQLIGLAGFLKGYDDFSVIKSAYQGKGLGKKLYQERLKYAQENHFPYLHASIQKGNEASIKIGLHNGWKIVGSQKVDGVDSYILVKPLSLRGNLYLIKTYLYLHLMSLIRRR